MKKPYAFKKDKYKTSRGKYSRLFNLSCRKCKAFCALYQKDGSGNLRRLYFDRIFAPKPFVGLEEKPFNKIFQFSTSLERSGDWWFEISYGGKL